MPETDAEGTSRTAWQTAVEAELEALIGAGAAPCAERWMHRLPASYRNAIAPPDTARDLVELEQLGDGPVVPGPEMRVRFSPVAGVDGLVCLSAYSGPDDLELSRLLPVLESLGLWIADELHWTLAEGDRRWHVYDVRLRRVDAQPFDLDLDADRVADAVLAQWTGRTEVDGLNRLVVHAGLDWTDVDLLRALVRYRRQVDPRYTVSYAFDVLVSNPTIAHDLVELFAARFDPDRLDPVRAEAVHEVIEAACDAVARLDDDRILRGLLGTVDAVLRTNRWTRPAGPLAVKLDSGRVPDAPSPVPYREIWVHGRDVHGIHLRAGAVARGGIRWSERPQDLRTEILDLMRTQVLKNALIVPTGAKGGFVLVGPRALEPSPADVQAAYEAFIGSLLDLTDDRRNGSVVPVAGRLDGDDPYLVVAADRGTARFSDVANRISVERGYWLGDAFASGGSNGFDHKALGVTARGAWTAVAHHFAELGIDVQSDRISVVGIGDLSGDVFGNGMLRSDSVALVAAFDHRDIFIDPDPDPKASFAERERIAALASSSWQDYDRSLISKGGGVFSRDEKSVELSRQMRDVLRVSDAQLTPAALVRAILQAPVDLLFAGGIGTFVRATAEEDIGVDDRANSEVRVAASSLRARVVGEGANLAFTQRARIEYARRGGRINVDAIDNSAGVDTSDREVNSKVLAHMAVVRGEIDAGDADHLVLDQREVVVDAVLEDTSRQCERLSIAQAASATQPDWFERVLLDLEADGTLDAAVLVLPDEAELEVRRTAGAGLTRPEVAVVMAGLKRWLAAQLLAGDLPDDPAMQPALDRYFPEALVARFGHLLGEHPLRRELVACQVTNEVVDLLGMTFVHRIGHDSAATPDEVVAAAAVAYGVVGAPRLFGLLQRDIGEPTSDPARRDPRWLVVDLIGSLTRWELDHRGSDRIDIDARTAEDHPVFKALLGALEDIGTPRQLEARRSLRAELVDVGVEPEVAAWAARLPDLRITPDIAALSRELAVAPGEVAGAYAALDGLLELDELGDRIAALDPPGRWAQASQQGLLQDLAAIRRTGVRRALAAADGRDPESAVEAFLGRAADEIADATAFRRDAGADPESGLDGLTVVVRAVRRAVTLT